LLSRSACSLGGFRPGNGREGVNGGGKMRLPVRLSRVRLVSAGRRGPTSGYRATVGILRFVVRRISSAPKQGCRLFDFQSRKPAIAASHISLAEDNCLGLRIVDARRVNRFAATLAATAAQRALSAESVTRRAGQCSAEGGHCHRQKIRTSGPTFRAGDGSQQSACC
jgi:hypothetical protein